ncbi:MAG: phosphate ABC transporter permease subunit PstC [Gemmatimonadetes bacterium]|nr:phosphate ABC transporter permease subunit PstC [Gemmatimonadota bacterium]
MTPASLFRQSIDWKELAVRGGLLLCASISVLTTIGIVVVLATESFGFFRHVPVHDFLLGTRWAPLLEPRSFGVLPLVSGTMIVVVGSAVVAVPTGLATAIYLSEYASPRFRSIVKPVLEILAGIPTVVYGYFALTTITPALRAIFPATEVFNAASAAIVVGVMILPMVASLCEDALSSVPRAQREAGFALGATRGEVATQIVVPAAASGVVASFVLALSRAIGETMAVTLAAGATPRFSLNLLESIQTMTAYIVQVSLGDTPAHTVEYQTIFAVGALLFLITLGLNVLAHRFLRGIHRIGE